MLAEERKLKIKENVKKYWKYIAGIMVTIGLMVFLIIKSDPKEIIKSFQNIDYRFMFLAILCMFVLFIIKTSRWLLILRIQGIKISFLEAFYLVLIGAFGSSITPAKIGDVLRAFYLSKSNEDVKIGEGVFSVILDRLLDLAGIFILLSISFPFVLLGVNFELISWWMILGIIGGCVIFILMIIFVFNKKISQPLINLLIKFLSKMFRKQEVKDKVQLSSEEIISDFYVHQKKFRVGHYLLLGALSLSFWLLLGIQGSVLIRAFSSESVGILMLCTTLCLAAIIAMAIPISISGIGIRDFVIVYFLSFLTGLGETFEATIVSMSVVQTALNVLIPGLIGGLLVLLSRRILQWQKSKLKTIPA